MPAPIAIEDRPPLVVRSPEQHISPTTPKYWFGNDPFMTHFYNAVSSTFPEGERFFIRSVRQFADQLDDPLLAAQVTAFIAQEGRHSKEHDTHVATLDSQGFRMLGWLNGNQRKAMNFFVKHTPRYALGVTTAIEHITAIFADEIMRNPEQRLGPMSDDMAVIWRWHALEEAEHKAVAYDVYQRAISKTWLRRLAMSQALVGFLAEVALRHTLLLILDKQFTPRTLFKGFTDLFGRKGLLRSIAPNLLVFFKRDFHPWQHDNRHLIAQRKADWGLV